MRVLLPIVASVRPPAPRSKARGGRATRPNQIDPRAAYKWQGTNHGTWCDNSADCNGWSKWLIQVQSGKEKRIKTCIRYIIEPLIK